MRKRYNIFIISRLYLKNYYRFVVDDTNISKSSDAYTLFMYSMKKLYGLEAVEYSGVVDKYGEACIERLKNTEGTPKIISSMSFDDRVRVVSVCEGFAQATNILSYKSIVNNRLKEG